MIRTGSRAKDRLIADFKIALILLSAVTRPEVF